MTTVVPLARRFQKITKDADSDETESFRVLAGLSKQKVWVDLHLAYRTVVLADAGAGKTFEFEKQADQLHKQGHKAFFLRIEHIAADLNASFEIGTSDQFSQWLQSHDDEAWFFLDSVDEARLDDPRAFENAIECFAAAIHDAMHRAHICISSRPYAWRANLDRDMLKRLLPFAKKRQETAEPNLSSDLDRKKTKEHQAEKPDADDESELVVHWLCPLNRVDIRFYAGHRGVADLEDMLNAIERSDLWSMAERPFDLDDLVQSWRARESFSNRLEILRNGVRRRLEEIHPDRGERQPLRIDQALLGARRLAAAVVLSNQPGIQVPEGQHNSVGLNAEVVLESWLPSDIKALLSRGLFNDAIYGAVRIRHREIRDLLAAEWFHELLKAGAPRHKVEALIFAEQYGAQVIRPRMRPILPWLILLDEPIRNRTLKLHPEIAVEGGDVSRLPLPVRKRILRDMVAQIVQQEDDRNGRHNEAIARIASTDLESDAKELMAKHAGDDDAIFFLGRFVWQGKLVACLPQLGAIASDPKRGIYARIAATRAIATAGTKVQRNDLWQKLLRLSELFQRRLLVELIDTAKPDYVTVDMLIQTLAELEPHERYESTGLSQSLHDFVDRFEITKKTEQVDSLFRIIKKLNELLACEPHIEPKKCLISKEKRWLLPIALHAIKNLIQIRSKVSFDPVVTAILLKAPTVGVWSDYESNDHELELGKAVADWPELNDFLFWASVTETRAEIYLEKGEHLTDDWKVSWQGHYWQLDTDSFTRVIKWVSDKEISHDRLVALSRAFRIFSSNDRSQPLLAKLKQVASTEAVLKARLNCLLKPPISKDEKKWKQEDEQRKRRQRERELKETGVRTAWIAELQADPERVRYPKKLKLGEWSNDQYWLLRDIEDKGKSGNRTRGADWRAVSPEFGEQVARAYRDAAVAFWRTYSPGLGSEGFNTNSTPYAQNFALAGLTIEANEEPNFPHNLTLAEAQHALRYFVCELNGFPSWFERLYDAFPEQAFSLVWQELAWELKSETHEKSLHYVLHDLVYFAPWLHKPLISSLLDWLRTHNVSNADSLRYALHILKGGGVEKYRLAALAQTKLLQECPSWQHPSWYALWVDTEPEVAISSLEQEFEFVVEANEVSLFAQQFIVALIGERRSTGPSIGEFKSAEHLEALYTLMNRYIRVDEDIDRANKGVYSPQMRDHAQDARNRLLNILCEIPGKLTYAALQKLAYAHPNGESRSWMVRLAHNRAVADADLPVWSAQNVSEFMRDAEVTPTSHKELFDIGVSRLTDFKAWLHHGNDSLAETYKRIPDETEMRNVVAHRLNVHAASRYVCAQEHELANGQRLDICLLSPQVNTPVPIELKLLDKKWTGADLCERLRNQLVGDYLREQYANCGIMLLIWQGKSPTKKWQIQGRRVGVSELEAAMQAYWQSIATDYPNVEAVKVIVIDLTVRTKTSRG
jgi:hypothetical protein